MSLRQGRALRMISRMSHPITRRDFLRACTLTGAGAVAGLHHRLLKAAARSGSAGPVSGNIRVGLDIGSSKVCAAVGGMLSNGRIRLLGIAQVPSRGVTAHGIVDPKAAGACIREALVGAEIQSDIAIRRVALAVPGTKIAGDSVQAWERIFGWEEACYADRGDGILESVSLTDCWGRGPIPIVYGANQRIQHSVGCLREIGVEVERCVFSPVAGAAAMADDHEKEDGVLHVDMGHGTTDFAVYVGRRLIASDCIPVGTERIANDLSFGLRIPLDCAERLLVEHGSAQTRLLFPAAKDRFIVLPKRPGFAGEKIERQCTDAIIRERVSTAFERVKNLLTDHGVEFHSLRHLRLGGGASCLPGIGCLAKKVFDLSPASRFQISGLDAEARILTDPRLACAVGLLIFEARR